jgi:hypothetical protein
MTQKVRAKLSEATKRAGRTDWERVKKEIPKETEIETQEDSEKASK